MGSACVIPSDLSTLLKAAGALVFPLVGLKHWYLSSNDHCKKLQRWGAIPRSLVAKLERDLGTANKKECLSAFIFQFKLAKS